MICIDNTCTDPFFNIAAEEYLLKNFTEDVFMMWQNRPSVIIGKHQDVSAEVNLDFVQRESIPVARRFSGGGAVYNDLGSVNLTFISNSSLDFDRYPSMMLDFLRTLGIHAERDERRTLTIGGLKISGSAQYVYKGTMLYHASLLFSADLKPLEVALDSRSHPAEVGRKFHVKSVKSPVTNINAYLRNPMQMADFKKHIIGYFVTINPMSKLYNFNKKDCEAISKLKSEKYETVGWNFGSYQPVHLI